MEIQNQLRILLEQALARLNLPTAALTFDLPPDLNHGDFATSIALRLTKTVGKPPLQIAQEIADAIPPNDIIEKSEILKPGFINIFLKPSALTVTASPTHVEKKRILVEYTDPNPFKEFHIGHLYSNTVGEAIARLYESQGHDVVRLCYQGDVGIHVACSIYGMIEGDLPDDLQDRNLEEMEQSLSLTDRVKWLGKCYAYGATANKDNPVAAAMIKKLNAQIFLIAQQMHQANTPGFVSQVDYQKFVSEEVYPSETVSKYYTAGRRWTLEYFEQIYRRLGTHSTRPDAQGAFDHYYFESEVAEYGYTTVQKHLTSGLFEIGEGGAIVSSKEKNGLHTRVFINALGLPTYEAKELGLNPEKQKRYQFDHSIIVTANEINEYFKVLLWNLCQIDPYVGAHTTHIGHGVVRLPEGKMSSRTGKILSGESLIEEAKSRILDKMSQSTRETGSGTTPDDTAAEKIAIAAVKYSLLKTNIGRDVVFSFDESLSFEGNSGPYILYTIVRCKSILGKATSEELGASSRQKGSDLQLVARSCDDLLLLRLLARSSTVYALAAQMMAPHTVCTYLYTLASAFSSYYAKVNILKTEDVRLRQTRLHLVSLVAQTLTQGCHLLGFETVEKM